MDSAQDFWASWARLSRLSKSEAERRLGKVGLHAGQQFVLDCLWEEDGLTSGEIAGRIGIEAATLTRALRRMEAADLVVRKVDENDRRRVRTWLTPRAVTLREEVRAIMERLAEDAVALLSDEETKVLVGLLERVRISLSERHTPASGPG